MSEQSEKLKTRREFFTTILRHASLGVLGVIGGAAFAKRRRLARNGICINRQICRSCGIFDKCDLPRALTAKTTLNENRK